MTPQDFSLVILSATPLLLPLFHGMCVRAARVCGLKAPAQAITVLVVLAGMPLALAACWRWSWSRLPDDSLIWSIAYAAVVYLSFGYAYFHLFNMTETARRIRVLNDFDLKGPMRAEELAANYSAEHMLDVRLRRLIDLGQLKEEGGRYYIRSRALLTCANLVAAYGRLLDSSWTAPAKVSADRKECRSPD